jgi:hypothetical protein
LDKVVGFGNRKKGTIFDYLCAIMRKTVLIPVAALLLASCKTYHYYEPPLNHPVLANAGEVQVSGNIGTAGTTLKGGFAATDKLLVAAMYNRTFPTEYRAREFETSVGYNLGLSGKGLMHAVYGGIALGSNYKQDSGVAYKSFEGNYQKYFMQIGGGGIDGQLGKSSVRGGGVYAFRLNYMEYRGFRNSSTERNVFNASNWFMDVYLGANIGGRYWRLEFGEAFTFKTDLKAINDRERNIRIFPMSFNIGLNIIINRNYE